MDALGSAGHALAKPQRARVIFLGVVDGLERLRADALDIPQVKELMRGDGRQRIERLLHHVGIEFDGGGVSVLHTTSSRPSREVIEKRVSVEWSIVHPTRSGGDNPVQRRDNLRHIVVGGVGVDDHAEVATGFVEVGFLKSADFDRRVDEAVIVRGVELIV